MMHKSEPGGVLASTSCGPAKCPAVPACNQWNPDLRAAAVDCARCVKSNSNKPLQRWLQAVSESGMIVSTRRSHAPCRQVMHSSDHALIGVSERPPTFDESAGQAL